MSAPKISLSAGKTAEAPNGFDPATATAIGGATGLAVGPASAFRRGAEKTAAETKKALLACLRASSRGDRLWQVLE